MTEPGLFAIVRAAAAAGAAQQAAAITAAAQQVAGLSSGNQFAMRLATLVLATPSFIPLSMLYPVLYTRHLAHGIHLFNVKRVFPNRWPGCMP